METPDHEDPLLDPAQEKTLTLKFSDAKPYINTKTDADEDRKHMVNPSQLYFDEVSPTSSNNILSEDDELKPGESKKEQTFCGSITETVLFFKYIN